MISNGFQHQGIIIVTIGQVYKKISLVSINLKLKHLSKFRQQVYKKNNMLTSHL